MADPEKRKKAIFSIIIIAIMVVSTAGFVIDFSVSSSYKYNGFRFDTTQNGYATKINGKRIIFNSHPSELESIVVPKEIYDKFANSKLIMATYDPNSEIAESVAQAQYYLDSTLAEISSTYVMKGLTNNTGFSLPQIDCSNATAYVPVIFFEEGNESVQNFSLENDCIIAKASDLSGFITLVERVIYIVVGVMKE